MAAVRFSFFFFSYLPFASLPPSLCHFFLCSSSLSCFLSSSAFSVSLCSPSLPPSFFPLFITFSLLCIAQSFLSVNSTDSVFSKTAKCFYIKGSFASHSWCGGGPACSRRRRERRRCWRVTTVRLTALWFHMEEHASGRYSINNNMPLLKSDI